MSIENSSERQSQKAASPWRSRLQIALFCCSLLFMCSHTAKLISRFAQAPIAAEIAFNAGDFEMPDITICNSVPIVNTFYSNWTPKEILKLKKEYYHHRNKIISQLNLTSPRNSTEELLLTILERGTFKNHPRFTRVIYFT